MYTCISQESSEKQNSRMCVWCMCSIYIYVLQYSCLENLMDGGAW